MTVSMLLSSQKAVFEDKLSHNAVPSSQKAVFEDRKAFTTGLSSGKCLFEDKNAFTLGFVRRKAVIPDEIHLQKKHSSSYVTNEKSNMSRKDYS